MVFLTDLAILDDLANVGRGLDPVVGTLEFEFPIDGKVDGVSYGGPVSGLKLAEFQVVAHASKHLAEIVQSVEVFAAGNDSGQNRACEILVTVTDVSLFPFGTCLF